MVSAGSPVPLAEVRETARRGRLFDVPDEVAQGKPEDWAGRLDLGSPVMLQELAEVAAEDYELEQASAPFRLLCRRMNDSYNSSWHEHERLSLHYRANPAFMNPLDMEQLGIAEEDIVEIASATASILGVATEAPDVRRGCVSMPHCWGANPGEPEDPLTDGASTARLVSAESDLERYTAMPRMSALPITVRRLAPPADTASADPGPAQRGRPARVPVSGRSFP
jgi:anaerobic selenocysteine-containing dehydrogenase